MGVRLAVVPPGIDSLKEGRVGHGHLESVRSVGVEWVVPRVGGASLPGSMRRLLMIQPQAEDARKAGSAGAVDAVGPHLGEHDIVGRDKALIDKLI